MRGEIIAPATKIKRKLKIQDVRKGIHAELARIWRESARAYFAAVAQLVEIDTGMSMASMIPLAAKVQYAKEIKDAVSGREAKKGWYDLHKVYHKDKFRSRTGGEREARKRIGREHVFSIGTASNPKFEFRFEIVIFHWIMRPNATKAIDAGEVAFKTTFNALIKKSNIGRDIVSYMRTGRPTVRRYDG